MDVFTSIDADGAAGLRVLGAPDVVWLGALGSAHGSQRAWRIGRDSACDLHLEDLTVSSVHCELIATRSGYVVRDLGSKNGLRAGREGPLGRFQRVKQAVLRVDHYLRLGDVTLGVTDRDGRCTLFAHTERDFFRQACRIYGSPDEAARAVGFSGSELAQLRRYMREAS